jgi:hypothetical protein
VLTEVYAKLVALVTQHWVLVVTTWQEPERSMVKGAQAVRMHACHLACVFADGAQLAAALRQIAGCVAASVRISRRRKLPNTYQRLQAVAA